jgi:hypothetical protein
MKKNIYNVNFIENMNFIFCYTNLFQKMTSESHKLCQPMSRHIYTETQTDFESSEIRDAMITCFICEFTLVRGFPLGGCMFTCTNCLDTYEKNLLVFGELIGK